MPANVERSKLYTFKCQIYGNYVKIVTGRDDGYLTFSDVMVFANNLSQPCEHKSTKEFQDVNRFVLKLLDTTLSL